MLLLTTWEMRYILMSLLNCPECGKRISSHARQCPDCGYPIMAQDEPVAPRLKSTYKYSTTKKHGTIIAVVIIIAIIVFFVWNSNWQNKFVLKEGDYSLYSGREYMVTNVTNNKYSIKAVVEFWRGVGNDKETWTKTFYIGSIGPHGERTFWVSDDDIKSSYQGDAELDFWRGHTVKRIEYQ